MELVTKREGGVTTKTLTLSGKQDYLDHEDEFLGLMEELAQGHDPDAIVKVEFVIGYMGETYDQL